MDQGSQMTDMQAAFRMLGAEFPTAIQRVDYPIHKGKPNPVHGKYIFVGRIPGNCYNLETKRSLHYATEQEAIVAAIAGGATRIQRADCSFVPGYGA